MSRHVFCLELNIGKVVLHASLSINNSTLPIISSVRDLSFTVEVIYPHHTLLRFKIPKL